MTALQYARYYLDSVKENLGRFEDANERTEINEVYRCLASIVRHLEEHGSGSNAEAQ